MPNIDRTVRRANLFAATTVFLIATLNVGAQQTERSPTNTAVHSSAAKSRSLPIFYEPALVAKGFPSPLAKAQINGHEALFIVDSGASVNTLADWYAKVAEIRTTAGSKATGSSGKTTAVRMAHQLQGQWSDGQRFTLKEAIVVAFPSPF